MEEFITTIDEARDYIDVELKESGQRITNLENENNEIKEENKSLKEKLQQAKEIIEQNEQKGTFRGKEAMNRFEADVEDYYTTAQKDMETFYFKIHEQILEFMDTSKKQFRDFSQQSQVKLFNEPKQELNTADSLYSRSPTYPKSPQSAYQTDKSPKWNRADSLNKSDASPSGSKNSKPLTPILKKSTSKKSLDQSAGTLNDITTDSKGSYKKRLGSASIGQLDTTYEKTVEFDLGENEGFRKSQMKDALSPKSSLLRAKLRSDVILQEMRKKLSESASHN